jgi:hypothetical protein
MDEALRIADIKKLIEESDVSAYPALSRRFIPTKENRCAILPAPCSGIRKNTSRSKKG